MKKEKPYGILVTVQHPDKPNSRPDQFIFRSYSDLSEFVDQHQECVIFVSCVPVYDRESDGKA